MLKLAAFLAISITAYKKGAINSENSTIVVSAAESVFLPFVSCKNLTFIFEVATASKAAMKIFSKNGLNRYATSARAQRAKMPKNTRLFIFFL